ncbi:MAG: YjaG family protein [Colwellia sp.]|nr:YjaG family protein [Colwellia sp.]
MSINLPFTKLSHWQQVAFSAALLERMLPNYQMFAETTQFGETSLIRNQLDLIWQWLDNSSAIKININAQLNKLEEQTPDPQQFDNFGVFPALDVCMALVSLWQLMQSHGKDENDDVMSISRLSLNSVSYYVELLIIEQNKSEEDNSSEELSEELEVEIAQTQINTHPLIEWEKDTQNVLFDFLRLTAENKRTCQLAKQLVLSEGISNLGIEIE